jgi:hypothetical protein
LEQFGGQEKAMPLAGWNRSKSKIGRSKIGDRLSPLYYPSSSTIAITSQFAINASVLPCEA